MHDEQQDTTQEFVSGEADSASDVVQAASEVDASLIRETLRLTPEERLLLNDHMILTLEELRRGFGRPGPG